MKQDTQEKALVVLSGGQDSATCLGLALNTFVGPVEAITFVYGQKHKVELECAIALTEKHKVKHKIVELAFVPELVRSALVGTLSGGVSKAHPDKPGLPASFVPGRNALFLTIAHAYAQTINAVRIYTGVCETDYSGYPDCRAEFINRLQDTLNTGYQTHIRILTPLMHINKGATFLLAAQHGFLEDILLYSHTCYEGDHTTWNEWGYGCGECPACKLRAAGYAQFKEHHPDFARAAQSNIAIIKARQ